MKTACLSAAGQQAAGGGNRTDLGGPPGGFPRGRRSGRHFDTPHAASPAWPPVSPTPPPPPPNATGITRRENSSRKARLISPRKTVPFTLDKGTMAVKKSAASPFAVLRSVWKLKPSPYSRPGDQLFVHQSTKNKKNSIGGHRQTATEEKN